MSVSAAILAGGQSRRMGTDKSLVLLDGKPLIRHVIDRLEPLAIPMIIITNQPEKYVQFALPLFKDVIPDRGSLGGLYSAVSYSQTDYILCVACDMPFLNTDLLHFLIAQRQGHDAIVPRIGERTEGLHAVYQKNCLPFMQRQVEQQRLKIAECLAQLNVKWVDEPTMYPFDPQMKSFVNLNSPNELHQINTYGVEFYE
ncbi:MAG: molybdenum cofactor guanylyltransferase [Anaerolineae bacterium]|nr:molybdenum cofactor guanylyltransferase [Anaerolineae bacterium]